MRKLLIIIASAFSGLAISREVFAQTFPTPDPKVQITKPEFLTLFTSVQQVISNAIIIVFIVAALAVFVMLIWGGISWIVSGGDKDKVADARKKIVNALVGLGILALSYLILSVIGSIIGFNPLQSFEIPTPQ